MEFSERLKSLRLKAKLTQIEVAEKIGVSQPQYARWEAGKRKPSSETLQKFADFFGVSMDYLAGKEEEDELANVELLFRMTSDGLTLEEKAVFREELIEFMKERKKAFEQEKNKSSKF
ncbi:helix-turn-helix domain-containing protein [Streptococcus suis]